VRRSGGTSGAWGRREAVRRCGGAGWGVLEDILPCPRVRQGVCHHGSRDGEPASGHWTTAGVDPELEREGRGGGGPRHGREAVVREIERLEMRGRCEEAARVARLWASCRKWAVSITGADNILAPVHNDNRC
jgi:hypothetical protein